MNEVLVRARLRGIKATVGGPRPLTRGESQANIEWLFGARPDLSDRQIARLLGVANSTVSRRRQGVASPRRDGQRAPGDEGQVGESAARAVAQRLFQALEKAEVDDGSIAFAFVGGRTPYQLADILSDAYGEAAVDRARTFVRWLNHAIGLLEAH
jgi:transcriptional regulator with XRE-family HTH domain